MSVPEVFIRDDGKGFVVRKDGVDFMAWDSEDGGTWYADRANEPLEALMTGRGDTIMGAVDNALAKLTVEFDEDRD